MKFANNRILILFAFILSLTLYVHAQSDLAYEFSYDIYRVYPSLSLTKEKMSDADSLIHLNTHYTSSWVKEYVSVELSGKSNGVIKKAVGKNDKLTKEQKQILKSADVDAEIFVLVKYIPDNNLSSNDVKEITFSFTVDPQKDANYPGGEEELKKYLKKQIIENVKLNSFTQHNLTAVKFSISKDGKILSPFVFQSSDNEDVDALLIETICKMPKWVPAEYSDGTKVEQEYVLAIGDMKSCVTNLINIREDLQYRGEE